MKIKLLNDGGFGDMDAVKFPVELEAEYHHTGCAMVNRGELYRVGATPGKFDLLSSWAFVRGLHWEVLP